MSDAGAEALFATARAVLGHAPDLRGGSRLMDWVYRRVRPRLDPERELVVRCDDGRWFPVRLGDPATWGLLMTRRYDPAETAFLRRTLRPGDVVFDVGANYGWYTTLCAVLVGPKGHVHAFEPVPSTYERLERVCVANELRDRVTLARCALGASTGDAVIYVPPHCGGASMQPFGDEPLAEVRCPVVPLDDYCRTRSVGRVRLVKCDVEGAELAVLRGAKALLSADPAPIWLLELNRGTSQRFAYEPETLLDLLRDHGYEVRRFGPDRSGSLVPLRSPDELSDVENVVCSVPGSGTAVL